MNDFNLIPTTGAPDGFPFIENHVRARLGLQKDEIRELRKLHLQEGQDWILKKKRVWLSSAAVAVLLRAKGLDAKTASPNAQTPNADDAGALKAKVPNADSKKNAPPKSEAGGGPVLLKVVQRCINKRMIQCCALDDNSLMPKKMVRVRVRNNEHFIRHMEVPATLVEGYTDLYDLARACPKKKGKW